MVLDSAVVEGRLRSFQYVHYQPINVWIFDGTGSVRDLRSVLAIEAGPDNLLGITHDGQIGVVGDHDDLPSLLGFRQHRHQ